MQEELRLAQPNRFGDRLTMRIVLAVGDVLQEEGRARGRRGRPLRPHRGDHPAR